MSKKTVVDAVNYAEGDIGGLFGSGVEFVSFFKDKYFKCNSNSVAKESGVDICTTEEFNQCVAEMSEGLFVPDCRPKQPEIQYDKDGNGWEVGSVYEFSDDGEKWSLGAFDRYFKTHVHQYHDIDDCSWRYIRECQSPIGKVHIKPVELVDGAVYQFESCSTGRLWVGFYNSADFAFYESTGGETNPVMIGSVQSFKNIIRLVPEVK